MMTPSREALLSSLLLAGVFAWTSTPAAPLVWHSSRERAIEAARNSGKLILLLAGRETCGNCQYMKSTVCEAPAVREVIDANYVCWFCPVDTSAEWYVYADGLGSFYLPMICVIDPGDPNRYLDRTTSVQYEVPFRERLRAHLPSGPVSVAIERASPCRVTWSTAAGHTYRVLRAEDLVEWSFLGGAVTGTGSPAVMEDPSAKGRCYFRVMGFR